MLSVVFLDNADCRYCLNKGVTGGDDNANDTSTGDLQDVGQIPNLLESISDSKSDKDQDLGFSVLGHTSLQMIFQTYHSWIKRATQNNGSAMMEN